jgi:aspartate carbamoyltransferase catalytic subunit
MPRSGPGGRHLLDVDDLSDDAVEDILRRAASFAAGARPHSSDFADRLIATLFFEPSTRTRLSFEAAAHRLGARVIGFSDAGATSARKGESLEDTIRTIAGYADLLVLRHPEPGSAARAARVSQVPIVNAGDGDHAHPTQALLDLYTLQAERGATRGHSVVLLGDLRHGRTVHSLAVLLTRFGNQVTLVAPPGLEMPAEVIAKCRESGAAPRQTHDLGEAVADADVLYVTRIQKERMDPADYARLSGSYRVDAALLSRASSDLLVLHPLPRVDEIDPAVDDGPGAAYFRQAANGVPVRMAILARILEKN